MQNVLIYILYIFDGQICLQQNFSFFSFVQIVKLILILLHLQLLFSFEHVKQKICIFEKQRQAVLFVISFESVVI